MLVQTSTGFRFTPPVDALRPTGDIPRVLEKSAALTALVVDDEPLVRWSIAETLRGRGYEVLEAGDGDGALHAIFEGDVVPDVVLLDLRLPDCTDLRLLETVREILPNAPIILMTSFGSPEVTQRARELGAYAVLDKPFDLNDLDPLIAHALR
jgi:DNA-binding NtrC family response regulator